MRYQDKTEVRVGRFEYVETSFSEAVLPSEAIECQEGCSWATALARSTAAHSRDTSELGTEYVVGTPTGCKAVRPACMLTLIAGEFACDIVEAANDCGQLR